jgi:hypothetical protein
MDRDDNKCQLAPPHRCCCNHYCITTCLKASSCRPSCCPSSPPCCCCQADQPGGRGARGGTSAALRSDEGLKAVVAAYEAKQVDLGKENRDLKAALASLQVGLKSFSQLSGLGAA